VDDDALAEEGEACAAVHLALDHLDLSVESDLSSGTEEFRLGKLMADWAGERETRLL
jgi:hypothetical protein